MWELLGAIVTNTWLVAKWWLNQRREGKCSYSFLSTWPYVSTQQLQQHKQQ